MLSVINTQSSRRKWNLVPKIFLCARRSLPYEEASEVWQWPLGCFKSWTINFPELPLQERECQQQLPEADSPASRREPAVEMDRGLERGAVLTVGRDRRCSVQV